MAVLVVSRTMPNLEQKKNVWNKQRTKKDKRTCMLRGCGLPFILIIIVLSFILSIYTNFLCVLFFLCGQGTTAASVLKFKMISHILTSCSEYGGSSCYLVFHKINKEETVLPRCFTCRVTVSYDSNLQHLHRVRTEYSRMSVVYFNFSVCFLNMRVGVDFTALFSW